MTLYLVTLDICLNPLSYNDELVVVGIFDSKEKAEKSIEIICGDDDNCKRDYHITDVELNKLYEQRNSKEHRTLH